MSVEELKVGSVGEEVKLLQKALAEKTRTHLSFDGSFGNLTKTVLMKYQSSNNLKPTGVYDTATRATLEDFIDYKYVRVEDIEDYANAIKVDPTIMKALAIKEAKASGFSSFGRCLILYERHIFHRLATRKFGKDKVAMWTKQNPNLCSPVWSKNSYYGGEREWDRLNTAKNWDAETALASCSWGMFQIMGFNHSLCGYQTVGQYAADMLKSERYHLEALTNFIKNNSKLYIAVKSINFEDIARIYNGPRYKENRYDTDLKKIYNKVKESEQNK